MNKYIFALKYYAVVGINIVKSNYIMEQICPSRQFPASMALAEGGGEASELFIPQH
jgi:hypothetical protein